VLFIFSLYEKKDFSFKDLPPRRVADTGQLRFTRMSAGEILSREDSNWDKLSDTQKQGILDAIDELDSKKGVSNKVVIDKFRKRYSNG